MIDKDINIQFKFEDEQIDNIVHYIFEIMLYLDTLYRMEKNNVDKDELFVLLTKFKNLYNVLNAAHYKIHTLIQWRKILNRKEELERMVSNMRHAMHELGTLKKSRNNWKNKYKKLKKRLS